MAVEEKQFIITEKWLEDIRACKAGLQAFKKHFPNGGEALEVLKRCEELNYIYFGKWLVEYLPPIYPPLVLNTFVGNLLYPGDVHIKGDISTEGLICTKGSLKVDGKLTVNKYGIVYSYKDCVNADEIDISGDAYICSEIKANSISMSGRTNIHGSVDADEIINDGGLIDGNVNTIKIDNINGGKVTGKITYKRSDEHK